MNSSQHDQHEKTIAFVPECLEEAEQDLAQLGRSPSMARWPTTDLSFPSLSPSTSMNTPGRRQQYTSNNGLDSPLGTRAQRRTPPRMVELESPIRFIGRSPIMPVTPGRTRSCNGLLCSFVISESEAFCSHCMEMYAGSPPRREDLWQQSPGSISTSPARSSLAFETSNGTNRRRRSASPDLITILALASQHDAMDDMNVVTPRLEEASPLASEDGGTPNTTTSSSGTEAGDWSPRDEEFLAALIPLPESDDEAEAEEGEGEQVQASTSNGGFSSFIHPDAPNWQWIQESEVKEKITRRVVDGQEIPAAFTPVLEEFFPPEQRHVQLVNGRYQCRATAGVDKTIDQWRLHPCGHPTYKHLNDYRRHLMCEHLGDERAEVRYPKNKAVGSSQKGKKRKTRKTGDDDEWGGHRGQSKRVRRE